ncbi:MAG: dprA [Cryobacterium sp.]|jgi:DNA protecting protein DprA|nr:dprA [Cryobacterium sp.]
MTLFGLAESSVLEYVRGVRAPQTAADAATTFASAAWSCIAEPGDGTAGFLVGRLGASTALAAVIDPGMRARLADALRDTGVDQRDDLAARIDQGLQRWRPRLRSSDVIVALQQAERSATKLLLPGDGLWPAAVDDLGAHAPLVLWWRGVPAAFESLTLSIALVGARAASGYGEHVAMEVAAGLADRGFAIVSGAAYGIDGMAHRSALASRGLTVAFLAGGVDRFYPSGHDSLLARIAEVGAVVSELPCGSAPTKWRFLQRNRLIAASSRATVVLEAGWRSGSLNTAGHAAAMGRPLGAVPGPVTSPTSAGCHRLIREYGAVCVTNAAEMAELVIAVGSEGAVPTPEGRSGPTSDEVRVRDALSSRSARRVDDIAHRSGMAVAAVRGVLGALALDGAASERPGGWVRAAD